jgi:HK97 family phage prohead protease
MLKTRKKQKIRIYNKNKEINMKRENRSYSIEDVQLRAFEEDNKRYLEGYAARYNVESKLLHENGKVFKEVLLPGAFRNVLANDVYLTFNHSRDKILARTINSTLVLTEDENGLFFRAEINNTSAANDLYEMVIRGDVAENSFAFSVTNEGQKWSRTQEGDPLREVSEISRLFDVSVVVTPAYPDTSVWARGFEEFVREEVQTETIINKEPYEDQVTLLKLKKIT